MNSEAKIIDIAKQTTESISLKMILAEKSDYISLKGRSVIAHGKTIRTEEIVPRELEVENYYIVLLSGLVGLFVKIDASTCEHPFVGFAQPGEFVGSLNSPMYSQVINCASDVLIINKSSLTKEESNVIEAEIILQRLKHLENYVMKTGEDAAWAVGAGERMEALKTKADERLAAHDNKNRDFYCSKSRYTTMANVSTSYGRTILRDWLRQGRIGFVKPEA